MQKKAERPIAGMPAYPTARLSPTVRMIKIPTIPKMRTRYFIYTCRSFDDAPKIPSGRKSRNTTRTANATVSFQPAEIPQRPRLSTRPRNNPPTRAPGMLPTQPITAAMMPLIAAFSPIPGCRPVSKARMAPAIPANIDPKKKTIRTTPSE